MGFGTASYCDKMLFLVGGENVWGKPKLEFGSYSTISKNWVHLCSTFLTTSHLGICPLSPHSCDPDPDRCSEGQEPTCTCLFRAEPRVRLWPGMECSTFGWAEQFTDRLWLHRNNIVVGEGRVIRPKRSPAQVLSLPGLRNLGVVHGSWRREIASYWCRERTWDWKSGSVSLDGVCSFCVHRTSHLENVGCVIVRTSGFFGIRISWFSCKLFSFSCWASFKSSITWLGRVGWGAGKVSLCY